VLPHGVNCTQTKQKNKNIIYYSGISAILAKSGKFSKKLLRRGIAMKGTIKGSFTVLFLTIILVLSSAVQVFAAEEVSSISTAETTVVLKNDWVKPEGSRGFFANGLWLYTHKDKFGIGFDSCENYKDGYYQIDPFITYDKGHWSGLVGFSSNNLGNNFVQVGFWYTKTYNKKLSVFVDIRNYFTVSGKQNSYLDNFMEITYPIGDKFYAGIDVEYLKWWDNSSHQCFFVGPLVGYKLSKNVHMFLRVSEEWDKKNHKTSTETDRVRLGLKFMF
jgi:hypothetical protein